MTSPLVDVIVNIPRLTWLWLATLPPFMTPRKRMQHFSGIWEPEDLDVLSGDIERLMQFDLYLRYRIACPVSMSRGHRAWEYALGMNYFDDMSGMKVLDIGTGNSTYAAYASLRGADVTTLDMPDPQAKPLKWSRWKQKRYHTTRVGADMLSIPLDDDRFDLVTSISVIEHLNQEPFTWQPVSNKLFYTRTVDTLREMSRVVKPGGYLYVTTDVYIPTQAEIEINHDPESTARKLGYTMEDIETFWLPTLVDAGMSLVQPKELSEQHVVAMTKRDLSAPLNRKRPFAVLARRGK